MPSDKKAPITRTDLDVVATEIRSLREVMENELRHLRNEVIENTAWRQAFMNEDGPWRKMDNRVTDVEYLARSVKWVVVAISPIATWAAIEIGKMLFVYLQKGP